MSPAYKVALLLQTPLYFPKSQGILYEPRVREMHSGVIPMLCVPERPSVSQRDRESCIMGPFRRTQVRDSNPWGLEAFPGLPISETLIDQDLM